jgi:CheY-like chemotaxis protein
MMPGMDGWAVLKKLKADPETAAIPVLMCTILRDEAMAYALGAAEFLTKPVDRERLLRVLARHRREGENTALVIEDDPASRDVLVRLLEREGWRVRQAQDGRQGLERIAEEAPALILLDLMMPVMDGFDFLHELRAHEPWRRLPVVVVTARELTPDERRFLEDSTERVVQKGAGSPEALLDVLRAAIGGRAPG